MRTAIDFPPDPDTLILCDIENLAGAASPTARDVRQIDALIHRAFGAGLLEVLACDAHNAEVVWFNWTHEVRRLVGRGPDGADLELIGVLRHERIEQRFRRVIIGSGDHIFAEPAMRLAAAGVQVVVGRGPGLLLGSSSPGGRRCGPSAADQPAPPPRPSPSDNAETRAPPAMRLVVSSARSRPLSRRPRPGEAAQRPPASEMGEHA